MKFKSELTLDLFLKQYSLDDYMVEIDDMLIKLYNYDPTVIDNMTDMQ